MTPKGETQTGHVPPEEACVNEIARWSLSDTCIIRRQCTSAGGFTTDILFDGRHVLSAASAERGQEVAYSRLGSDAPWENLLQQATRNWLARLGLESPLFDHHREVWLDWKVYGEPEGTTEEQMVMSLGEALAETAFSGSVPDWDLMEKVAGPFGLHDDEASDR